ncbi:MAG TPA: hypothetical protein PLP61_06395 [Nocardioides sp.]|uniref:hypothetical protein n=1 Tax=Nocardioides sp. TaxID=35761 RepID=UPI002B86ADA2|nr:hypothetical protein [Nocardioides sp.]HQR26655.1 hypothetical protein [Nocardioides sp.]
MSQPPPSYPSRAQHPRATTVLVLGVLGLVLCNILGPFAWVMGNRVVAEIDASGGALTGRESAVAGRICGIIGTGIVVAGLVAFVWLSLG